MKRIRLYRQGAHPHCGIEATLAAVENAPPLTGSDAAAAEVSQSGDLGYTYGVFTCELPGAKDEGEARYSYLRIWRKDSWGNWKIVLATDTPHHKKP